MRPSANGVPRHRCLGWLLGAMIAAQGCLSAPVLDGLLLHSESSPAGPYGGKSMRPAAKTIPLEVFFLRFDQDDPGQAELLWQQVDEQRIDDDLRRRLAANGLRAGILLGGLPGPLLAALEPPLTTEEGLPPAANTADATPPVIRRVLRILPGRESELVGLRARPELVVLEHDGSDVRGASYSDALPHFSLRAWPAADGRVRVELVPVIRHGPHERTFVGDDGAFKLEAGQRKRVLDRLRCETNVPADAMLVIGPAGEPGSTVGDALFRQRGEGRRELRLLALRPLARGIDPMFALRNGGSEGGDELSSAGEGLFSPVVPAIGSPFPGILPQAP